MPRLFSALRPPDEVCADLENALAGAQNQPGAALRWTPVERWHVTLGFFGDDDDPDRRIKWLTRRVTGRPAPRLRIAGSGTVPGVLWAGIESAASPDEVKLTKLAQAAGAGRRGYRPHLTLARWSARQRSDQRSDQGEPGRRKPDVPAALTGYTGPWFTPVEVLLVRSDLGVSGPAYQTIERVPLSGA